MTVQYWVGGFFIDLSRNQITQNKQSQTIAPKALAVLTYLAENQGKVVSHDALLTKVWQDTAVSPNTLQKSIAQLRKALGDSGNIYIKTHAKQGYSLECDVRWHDGEVVPSSKSMDEIQAALLGAGVASGVASKNDSTKEQDAVIPEIKSATTVNKPSRSIVSLTLVLATIVVLSIIGFKSLTTTQLPKLKVGEIRALTATDNKELAGIYSPDGQYIVFHRYSEKFCLNNIWAKNIKTQEEFQLTKNLYSYGSHSFSKDGKNLTFVQTGSCSQPVNQKKCYKLMTLDFHKALESPQAPRELMECKNSEIRMPKWLNNGNIALFQKDSNRWKLISYSIDENKSQDLHRVDTGNLIDYDYSVEDDLIALTSIKNDGHYYIEVIKPNGKILSSHQISFPNEIANFRTVSPNFTSIGEQLIFSTGRQLFTLSYDGQVTNISLPIDKSIGSPIFHPKGKRMLVTKGHYDSDIALMPIAQFDGVLTKNASINTTTNEQPQSLENSNYSVIERSIVGEDNALFQPNGELIAYDSGRSGEQQIWLTNGNGSQQLTHFPMDTYFDGMVWAADGQSILVNVVHELNQVFIDGSKKVYSLEHPIESLFDWDSENQIALANVRVKGILKFAELDLTNSTIRIINDKKIQWALKTENGQLIYNDHMGRFWRPGPAEDQLIEALNDQGSNKRFVIKDNVVYGINDDFQLWSYDLKEDTFEIRGYMPNNIDYLTDISQTDILISIRISAKKELAELILTD